MIQTLGEARLSPASARFPIVRAGQISILDPLHSISVIQAPPVLLLLMSLVSPSFEQRPARQRKRFSALSSEWFMVS